MQLVILVLWSVRNLINTSFSVPAAALSLGAAVLMLPLSHFEHIKSVRPSSLLNAYLLFSSILEAAQVRTLWLIADDRYIAVFSTISLGLRITSAILESCGKEKSLGAQYRLLAAESRSGLYSRSLFWWLNKVLLAGSRSVLRLKDLDSLSPNLSSKHLLEKFHRRWNTC